MAKGTQDSIATPSGCNLEATADGAIYRVNWDRVKLAFYIPVTLFMTLLFLIFLPFAIRGQIMAGLVPFFLGVMALEILLVYLTAAIMVNSTKITLSGRTVTVKHGPIWFPGNRSIDCTPDKFLVCRYLFKVKPNSDFKPIHRVVIESAVNSMIPDVIGYELTVRDAVGNRTVVVAHKSRDPVHWVQKNLNSKLKLRAVPDDTRRPD